jgi:putative component of membrane protein insertase Oxa1/YidC/SpoIIIJ protein YidD
MQKWLSKIFLVVCIGSSFAQAQNITPDIKLIKSQDFRNESFSKKRKVTFMLSKRKNVFVRYNPVSLAFGGLLYFYQKVISVQISANCPYEISCSAFAKRAILDFGFFKGIAVGADRLTRCTQFGAYDLNLAIELNDNQRLIDRVENYKHVHE